MSKFFFEFGVEGGKSARVYYTSFAGLQQAARGFAAFLGWAKTVDEAVDCLVETAKEVGLSDTVGQNK